MLELLRKATKRDASGDSPIEIIAALIGFMACMAALMALPGH